MGAPTHTVTSSRASQLCTPVWQSQELLLTFSYTQTHSFLAQSTFQGIALYLDLVHLIIPKDLPRLTTRKWRLDSLPENPDS